MSRKVRVEVIEIKVLKGSMDVQPKEIALFFGIDIETAVAMMEAGRILHFDFPCTRLTPRIIRGPRDEWEKIKAHCRPN